jgi:hypothetical protein
LNIFEIVVSSWVMRLFYRLIDAFDTPITRALPEHNLDELLQVTHRITSITVVHVR